MATPPKLILAINAGSSSVKISAYSVTDRDNPNPQELVETQIAGLTSPPTKFSYRSRKQTIRNQELDTEIGSQDEACSYMLNRLVEDENTPEINNRDDIAVACHRIVHGGDYEDARVINDETYHHLEELADLAPLHNSASLAIVRSCIKQLPKTKNIAYFDSAFHHSIPEHIYTYPIDPAVARKNKLRKYGFHGISYSFITRSVAAHLKKPIADTNIIALHLGSGASACAIKGGKSVDTSMGLTPLEGLPGATRSGSIDPSLVFHFTSDAGKPSPSSTSDMHISTAEDILNKHSGWKSLTGTTDFGKITAHAKSPSSSPPDPSRDTETSFPARANLAFNIFVDRILNFVGAYYIKLDGQVDALVFAGGIGEKSAELRRAVVGGVRCLGFGLEEARNGDVEKLREEEREGEEKVVVDIGQKGKDKKVQVCWTDEQYEMARQCASNATMWDQK